MKGWVRLPFILLIIFAAFPLAAQVGTRDEEGSLDSLPDSIIVTPDSAFQDSASAASLKNPKHGGKSVRTAMLLSTFIPGGGQFYNESYWKGGLVAAAELTLASFAVREHLLMVDVERMWSEDVADSIRLPQIDSLRWVYRDRRNVWAFFTGLVVAFSVADAYVDANMFGFKESQSLTIGPSGQGLGLAVRYRF